MTTEVMRKRINEFFDWIDENELEPVGRSVEQYVRIFKKTHVKKQWYLILTNALLYLYKPQRLIGTVSDNERVCNFHCEELHELMVSKNQIL